MDIFGGNWVGYMDKIRSDWQEKVTDEDIVLILKQIGVLQDERIYVREGSRHSDLLDDIHEQ